MITNEFKITKKDLICQVTDMEFTGISQKIIVELIPIPKSMYPALVKNEKVGGRVFFKDENDRKCFYYPFLKRRVNNDFN